MCHILGCLSVERFVVLFNKWSQFLFPLPRSDCDLIISSGTKNIFRTSSGVSRGKLVPIAPEAGMGWGVEHSAVPVQCAPSCL